MAEYRYDLDGRSGKFWHVVWKVRKMYEVAIPSGTVPELTGMSIAATEIVLRFAEPLTTEQENWLATLITDPDLFAPHMTGFVTVPGNVWAIIDVFEDMEDFNAWIDSMGISGLRGMLFEDADGNMEVHFNRTLTKQEKTDVLQAYQALGNWKA